MACFGARGTRKRGTWQHQNRDIATELPLLPCDGTVSCLLISLLITTTLMLQPRIGIRGKSSAAQITSCLKYMTSQGDTPLLIDCYNEMVGYRWAIFFHFTLCKTFICRYFVPGTIARAASVVHWSVGFSSLLLSPAGYTC